MRGASREFRNLKTSISGVASGMRRATTGALVFGAALSALSAPIAVGARGAVAFEHAMSGVQAVAGASREELSTLRTKALDLSLLPLGYSATEAAGAMEELARAGFSTNEILAATPGVMAAAAAEGMPMARAAEIVGISIRGMGLAATDAGHVADVLALAAARTNESINGFGEAMTYGASQARMMGLSLEETVAAFGIMANFGRRGSLAGTSFRQMLVRLAKPTQEAIDLYKAMGVQYEQLDTNTLGLSKVVETLRGGMERLSPTQRKSASAVLFGIRGMDSYNALLSATPGLLDTLTEALKAADGAAEKMAHTRLDNVYGGFLTLTKAVQSFWNVFFTPAQKGVTGILFQITDKVRSVVFAMQSLGDANPLQAIQDKMDVFASRAIQFGSQVWFMNPHTALSIAQGIRDGFEWIKRAVVDVSSAFKKVVDFFGGKDKAGDAARRYAALAVKIMAVIAAVGPLLVLMSAVNLAFGGAFEMIAGTATAMWSLGGAIKHVSGLKKALSTGWAAQMAAGLTKPFAGAGVAAAADGAAVLPGAAGAAGAGVAAGETAGVAGAAVTGAGAATAGSIAATLGIILVAILAAFLLLRKQGESITQTLVRLGAGIVTVFKEVIGFVVMLGQIVWETLKPIVVALAHLFEPIGMIVQKVFGFVISQAFIGLKNLFTDRIGPAFIVFGEIIGGIISAVDILFRAVLGTLSPTDASVQKFSKLLGIKDTTLVKIIQTATELLTGFPNRIKGAMESLKELYLSFMQWINPVAKFFGHDLTDDIDRLTGQLREARGEAVSVAAQQAGESTTVESTTGGKYRRNFLGKLIYEPTDIYDAQKAAPKMMETKQNEDLLRRKAEILQKQGLLKTPYAELPELARQAGEEAGKKLSEAQLAEITRRRTEFDAAYKAAITPVLTEDEKASFDRARAAAGGDQERLKAIKEAEEKRIIDKGTREPKITIEGGDVSVQTTLTTDGKTLAESMQRYKTTIQERAGSETTPYQRMFVRARAVEGMA